jgi:hypothetical protein
LGRVVWLKVKGEDTCYSASFRAKPYTEALSNLADVSCMQWDHTELPATHMYDLHQVLTFPAEAGTHSPTPGGWKAELALVAWYSLDGHPSRY